MLVNLRLVGLLAAALQATASSASVLSARGDVSAEAMATKVGEVENGFKVVAEEDITDRKLVWFSGQSSISLHVGDVKKSGSTSSKQPKETPPPPPMLAT